MLTILIKHFIYEKAINILFEHIELNFSTAQLMPTVGQLIDIRYFTRDDKYRKWVKNATVHKTTKHYLVILHTDWDIMVLANTDTAAPIIQLKMELIMKIDIISWTPRDNISRHKFYNGSNGN